MVEGGAAHKKGKRSGSRKPKSKKPAKKSTDLTVEELRKKASSYNKKHPDAKVSTTKKVKKGKETRYVPKDKAALKRSLKAKGVVH
jgi:hypothetical protein